MRLIEMLPYAPMLATGRIVRRIARRVPLASRMSPGATWSCVAGIVARAARALLNRHFECLGMALCESAMTWWRGPAQILALSRVEGLEHLETALARGKGAILLTSHFTTLEIGASIINAARPINVLYRPPKNEVLAAVAHRQRGERARQAIRRDDIRAMIRALKANEIVWYAPDQSYRKKVHRWCRSSVCLPPPIRSLHDSRP